MVHPPRARIPDQTDLCPSHGTSLLQVSVTNPHRRCRALLISTELIGASGQAGRAALGGSGVSAPPTACIHPARAPLYCRVVPG